MDARVVTSPEWAPAEFRDTTVAWSGLHVQDIYLRTSFRQRYRIQTKPNETSYTKSVKRKYII